MKPPFAHHLFGVSKRDCQLSSVRWRLESLSPSLCPAEVQPSVQCKGLQVTDKLNPQKTDPDLQESVAMSQVDFDLSSISSQVLVKNFWRFQQFFFWAHLPILQYTTTLEPKKLAWRRSKALCLSWRQKRSPLLLSLLEMVVMTGRWVDSWISNPWYCDASLFSLFVPLGSVFVAALWQSSYRYSTVWPL